MSAELAAILSVGGVLAGLILAAWRDVRAEVRTLSNRLDADRRAHDASHAAERQAIAADIRELRGAVTGRGSSVPR